MYDYLYDSLLASVDRSDFDQRAALIASKNFSANREKHFSLDGIAQFARLIVAEYSASGTTELRGVQATFGNSVIVVVAGAKHDFTLSATHSFGGLFYEKMERLVHFDVGGINAICFMRLAKIEPTPSFVRVESGVKVVNNGVSWDDDYLGSKFLRGMFPPPTALQQPAFSIVSRPPPLTDTITIGIPVYNSPHLFRKLFADLGNTVPDVENVAITVIDDCGDSFSSKALEALVGNLRSRFRKTSISLSVHEKNAGFIRTCNEMFDAARDRDLFVLLTTDIRLPKNWLPRIVAPFKDEKIAVATPWAINGANLEVKALPGHSWLDMDAIAKKKHATYPDAETTVGYCMAVRPSALGSNEELFSLAFENGYGDDSDLYYRLLNNGFRGVVIDNMVIYHQGGGSFDLLENVEQLRKDNFKTWSSLWMPLYQSRVFDIVARQNSIRKRYFSEPIAKKTDVLFVLPLDYRKAGGVESVFKIVEGLLDRGVNADIYCLRHHEGAEASKFEYRSYTAPDAPDLYALTRQIGNPKIVVSTSHDTAPFVQSLKSMIGCQSWWFVQGPEMAFSSGAFSASVTRDLRAADRILCVSPYLADLIDAVTGQPATLVPYGPDPFEFYGLGKNQMKTIAVHFAGRADKGSDLAGIAVPILLDAGYTVEAFGEVSDYFDYDPRLKPHGYVNASALRKIFQRSSHYLDLSHYEGLGMLTLEAVFCGAIPISMRNGGSAAMIEGEQAGIILDGLPAIHRLPQIIEAKSASVSVQSLEAVRRIANLDAAVIKFAEVLEAAI